MPGEGRGGEREPIGGTFAAELMHRIRLDSLEGLMYLKLWALTASQTRPCWARWTTDLTPHVQFSSFSNASVGPKPQPFSCCLMPRSASKDLCILTCGTHDWLPVVVGMREEQLMVWRQQKQPLRLSRSGSSLCMDERHNLKLRCMLPLALQWKRGRIINK